MLPQDPLIVFVDHYASGPSGISTYAAHLAAHLPDLHRVNLHADVLRADARTFDVPPERSHDPRHVAEVLIGIVRRHPERRVAWLPNVGDVAWAAAWRALNLLAPDERARVRVFGIVHGDQESQYAAMHRYAPLLAAVAGVSRQCVERLRHRLSGRGPAPELLNYPVPVPDERSQDDDSAPLRLLYAGRFEESQKCVSRLPVLFRTLAEAGVPFTATVAGDGPARVTLYDALRALPDDVARSLHLPGAVPRDRMTALLRAHDVLVLVSAYEGTPLVLLEAMASGVCPVLMDLPGGLPELLVHGVNARVVAPGDVPAMVAAIAELHRGRCDLARMKAAARATMARRADPALHARQLLMRLADLWRAPAPDPSRVTDPDPLGMRIERLVDNLAGDPSSRIAIWGAGVVGRQLVDRLLARGLTPALVVDADPVRHGAYRAVAVAAPTALRSINPEIVCVGSIAFADEIVSALQAWPVPPRVLVP